MPKISEEAKKAENELKKLLKENVGKSFEFRDIVKTLILNDVCVVESTIRKIIHKMIARNIIWVDQDERPYKYGYIVKKSNGIKEQKEDESYLKELKTNLQDIRLSISSLNTKVNNLPTKIIEDNSNILGTHILDKLKEEMGEWFQHFVKDIEEIKEDVKKSIKQNGAVINMLNELFKKIKLKERLFGR